MTEHTVIDKGWLEAWQKSVEDELVKMGRRVRKVGASNVDEQLADLWRYCDRLSAVFMDVEARLNKLEQRDEPTVKTASLSCPYCGSEAQLQDHSSVGYRVACLEPLCQARGPYSGAKVLAIAHWNKAKRGMRHADDG